MPTPFMCHWCDMTTMNETGICIECEQAYEEGNKDIAGTIRELETRIRWYEDALKEIIKCCDLRDNYGMIEDLAKTALDGEPTTADEHNVVRISDINKEIAEEWNRDREEKIRKESYEKSKEITEEDRKNYKKSMVTSIGYRGEE